MANRVLQGHPDIALTLRRSARARRITLRISSLDGRVTLTLPNNVPEGEALAFARHKEPWIRKHLAARVEDVAVGLGVVLPVEGQAREVIAGDGRAVQLLDQHLAVPGAAATVPRRVQGFLKSRARDVLAKLCPLDLAPASFGPGDFRRTRMAQIPAALWMEEDGSIGVICFRSVGEDAFGLLAAAAEGGPVGHL